MPRSHSTRPTKVVVLSTILTVGAVSTSSFAVPPAAKRDAARAAEPKAAVVGPLVAKLRSGSEGAVREALDELRIAGPRAKAAAPAVAELLEKGLSLPLTEAAIGTLADMEAETGARALAPYAAHRDPKLRRAAVGALVRCRGREATAALTRALSDSDGVVRGTAASGLGALRAKDAVPELFVALHHRVNEAAAAIGLLCDAGQCADLVNELGKLPFDVVTTGIEPLLLRPASEVGDDAKVKIIAMLRDLGTAESNKFLREMQGRAKEPAVSGKVKQAIDQAVTATSGGAR